MSGTPNDKITGGIVIILATGIMAILAGISDDLGKILLVIMAGFLLLWLIASGTQTDLSTWIGKLNA
jgi:hypothetical protein